MQQALLGRPSPRKVRLSKCAEAAIPQVTMAWRCSARRGGGFTRTFSLLDAVSQATFLNFRLRCSGLSSFEAKFPTTLPPLPSTPRHQPPTTLPPPSHQIRISPEKSEFEAKGVGLWCRGGGWGAAGVRAAGERGMPRRAAVSSKRDGPWGASRRRGVAIPCGGGAEVAPFWVETLVWHVQVTSKKSKRSKKLATKKGVLPFQRNSVECIHW